MSLVNHCFRLASRPVGLPKRGDWTYGAEPVREPREGEGGDGRLLHVCSGQCWSEESVAFMIAIWVAENWFCVGND